MDWERVEANWAHYKGLARERWNRITADELDAIGGRREQLAHRIHEIYGISKGTAQMQLESWQGALKHIDPKPA